MRSLWKQFAKLTALHQALSASRSAIDRNAAEMIAREREHIRKQLAVTQKEFRTKDEESGDKNAAVSVR